MEWESEYKMESGVDDRLRDTTSGIPSLHPSPKNADFDPLKGPPARNMKRSYPEPPKMLLPIP